VLIAAVWLGSGWFTAYWQAGKWLPFVAGGRFGVFHFDASQNWLPPTLASHEFAISYWRFEFRWNPTFCFAIPLWLPFLAVASIGIVREVLWRRRKSRPGHCPCGYPVAGLERCPECGEETA